MTPGRRRIPKRRNVKGGELKCYGLIRMDEKWWVWPMTKKDMFEEKWHSGTSGKNSKAEEEVYGRPEWRGRGSEYHRSQKQENVVRDNPLWRLLIGVTEGKRSWGLIGSVRLVALGEVSLVFNGQNALGLNVCGENVLGSMFSEASLSQCNSFQKS